MAFTPNYQIAAGYNNAAGLTAIQSITPSGDIPFVGPIAKGRKNPGQARIRGNGTALMVGFVSQPWDMVFLTYAQYEYLKSTYCGGGYSGLVTVRTSLTKNGTYANYNAVLNVPPEDTLKGNDRGWGYQPVTLTFTRMVAL